MATRVYLETNQLGARPGRELADAAFEAPRGPSAVDVVLANPPMPQGGPWSGAARRDGRRWPQHKPAAWPQVWLAHLAAMLAPDYNVAVVDATAQSLNWAKFEAILRAKVARYYVTQVRPASVESDMFGACLARELGASTIAVGPWAGLMAREILDRYPSLDFVLCGEAELTLRELVDTLESAAGRWSEDRAEATAWARLQGLFKAANPAWRPAWGVGGELGDQLKRVQGLAWRWQGEIQANPGRPLIPDLNDLPLAHQHLLPLHRYQMPPCKEPYTLVVTSRNGPAEQRALPTGATNIPNPVSTRASEARREPEPTGGNGVGLQPTSDRPASRLRAPENIMAELWLLHDLGVHHVHLLADAFSANREQASGLCHMIIAEELPLRWSCTGRVDQVDEGLLALMGRAGCWLIAWNLEAAMDQALPGRPNRYRSTQVPQALRWARQAGLKNWGYFTLGLPGETAERIEDTIAFAQALPLDLALFRPAPLNPANPFSWEHGENGSFPPNARRDGRRPAGSKTFENGQLNPEELAYWQRRAFREWAFGSGHLWSRLKGFGTWARYRHAADVGWPLAGWVNG